MFFFNSEYVNNSTKTIYTTGIYFTFFGGEAVYRYKNKKIADLSST